jgi:hypothetical protein
MSEWTKFISTRNVSTGREAGGANPQQPAMQYVENQRGQAVSENSVAMMRTLAQAIWMELGINGAASMAESWGNVDVESKRAYYRAMEVGFFELRLCDSNWKAEQIALDNYPLWLLRWHARPEFQTGEEGTGNKRVRKTSTMTGTSKKSKGKSKASVSPNIQFFPKCTHTLTRIVIMFPKHKPRACKHGYQLLAGNVVRR